MQGLAIDWGDVPTWIGAITTAGALIAAGLVVRVELRRDQRAMEDRARDEQAARVAAWPVYEFDLGPRILVFNGSPLPIYSVTVVLHSHFDKQPEPLDTIDVVPPGETFLQYPAKLLKTHAFGHQTLVHGEGDWFPELSFNDSAGRWWIRDSRGFLRFVRDEGPGSGS